MRVGFEATAALTGEKTGIEQYTFRLLLELARIASVDPDFSLYVYAHAGNPYVEPNTLAELKSVLSDAIFHIYRPRRGYAAFLYTAAIWDRIELLHLPRPARLPLACLRPFHIVVTFHDAKWAYLSAQDNQSEGSAKVQPITEYAIAHADHVIAVSESSRQQAIEALHVPPIRVSAIGHGVEPADESIVTLDSARRKYNLNRYILYVGALQHRKNLVRLIDAFEQMVEQGHREHTLVLVGRDGLGADEIHQRIARLSKPSMVRTPGYVPRQDLLALYRSAELFVFPSLHEGFGIPLIEAMQADIPVIASDIPPFREVCGNAAIFFNPGSTAELTERMIFLLQNRSERDRIVALGRQRVARFTWGAAAEQTISCYRRTLAGRHG